MKQGTLFPRQGIWSRFPNIISQMPLLSVFAPSPSLVWIFLMILIKTLLLPPTYHTLPANLHITYIYVSSVTISIHLSRTTSYTYTVILYFYILFISFSSISII